MKRTVYLTPPDFQIKVRKVAGAQAEMARRLKLTNVYNENPETGKIAFFVEDRFL